MTRLRIRLRAIADHWPILTDLRLGLRRNLARRESHPAFVDCPVCWSPMSQPCSRKAPVSDFRDGKHWRYHRTRHLRATLRSVTLWLLGDLLDIGGKLHAGSKP